MLISELKITNKNGDSIDFGRHFRLYEDIQLDALNASVIYAGSNTDGSTYQSTYLDNRDFDIPFYIKKSGRNQVWIEQKRAEVYKVFNPKNNPMRIDLVTKAGTKYFINANLEATPTLPTGFENNNRSWQIGLLQFSANDPYIYQSEPVTVEIAAWIGAFEFPLEIPEEGIEMGYRSQSLIANVFNSGQEQSGMDIRFRAVGTVVNPSLINVNTYEEFKLNFTMLGSDVIEISTYQKRKTISLIRNNVRTNIFSARRLGSKFLQLDVGDNLFRYDADVGLDSLEVFIRYTPRFIGV